MDWDISNMFFIPEHCFIYKKKKNQLYELATKLICSKDLVYTVPKCA